MLAFKSLFVPRRLAFFHIIQRNTPRRFLATQPENLRLNVLLSSVEDFLVQTRNPKLVADHVHRTLGQHIPHLSAPHIAFDKVISMLVEHQYIAEASSVYERMLNTGYLPSTTTDIQMMAAAFAISPNNGDEPTTDFDAFLTNPSLSEEGLLPLLRMMSKLNASPESIVHMIKRFVGARGENYALGRDVLAKLVDAQARSGKLEDAFETILRYGPLENDTVVRPPPHHAFTAILAFIRDNYPSDVGTIERVLEHIRVYNTLPDVSIFNVLISRAVRARSLHKAFDLYQAITQLSEASSLSPDDFTFGSLFNALDKLFDPDFQSRPRENAANVVPPRQLYRDMMTAINRPKAHAKRPFQPTTSLLNVALRTFLTKNDYAGAFVVVRSYPLLSVDIDAKTYKIVVNRMVDRIRWDVPVSRRRGLPRWRDRFLGILGTQTDVQTDEAAERMLSFSRKTHFSLFGDTATPSGQQTDERAYTTPTLAMMRGDELVPRGMKLDVVPLERILRRAILANLEQGGALFNRVPSARPVSDAIVDAKKEMLPQTKGRKL